MTPTEAITRILDAEEYGAVATVVTGPDAGTKAVIGSQGEVASGELPAEIAERVIDDARELMRHEQHRSLEYDDRTVFIEILAPPQELLIFGAVHIGQALCSFAAQMGYRVTLVDARAAFATEERFPMADRILVGWPGELLDQLTFDNRTWVVSLSHEPRHEDPVLVAALKSPVRYIGSMGSRRTQELRQERLANHGFDKDDIARVRGPVGLDIGAETPEEVAVSILAEMTLVRYGHGTGIALKGRAGRVHQQRPEGT